MKISPVISDIVLNAQYISVDCGYFPMLYSREYCPHCVERFIMEGKNGLGLNYLEMERGKLLFSLIYNDVNNNIVEKLKAGDFTTAKNILKDKIIEYNVLDTLCTNEIIDRVLNFVLAQKNYHEASIKLGQVFLDLFDEYECGNFEFWVSNLDSSFSKNRMLSLSDLELRQTIYREFYARVLTLINIEKGKVGEIIKGAIDKYATGDEIYLGQLFRNRKEIVFDGTNAFDFYKAQYETAKKRKLYIKKIHVERLFDYDISFSVNLNSDLTVVVGPNGLGKTTICNFLNTMFVWPMDDLGELEKKINFLESTPFKSFSVIMTDESKVTINRKGTHSFNIEYSFPGGENFFDELGTGLEIDFSKPESRIFLRQHCKYMSYLYPRLVDSCSNQFCYIGANRAIDYNRMSNPVFMMDFEGKRNNLWHNIVSLAKKYDKIEINKDLFRDLKQAIDSPIYSELAAGTSKNELLSHFECVSRNSLNEGVKNAILMIRELEALRKDYEQFCELFKNIYYEEDPSRKTIVIQDETLKIQNSRGKILDFVQLSTGEINIATILYYIVFNTTQNAIVLIDEPEISLHLTWQQQIVPIVKNIIREKQSMQVVMFSHSPFIPAGDEEIIEGVMLDE